MREIGARPVTAIDVPTVLALAGRALVLWILVWAVLAVLSALAGSPAMPAATQSGGGMAFPLLVPGVVALLMDIDVRATREAVFLATLGIGRRHVLAVTLAVAMAADVAAGLASGLLR